MNNVYTKGQVVTITANFSVDDVSTDPTTITFKIKSPSGTTESFVYGIDTEVERAGTGVYTINIDCDESGDFWYRAEGTGAVKDAFEKAFTVSRSRF